MHSLVSVACHCDHKVPVDYHKLFLCYGRCQVAILLKAKVFAMLFLKALW